MARKDETRNLIENRNGEGEAFVQQKLIIFADALDLEVRQRRRIRMRDFAGALDEGVKIAGRKEQEVALDEKYADLLVESSHASLV